MISQDAGEHRFNDGRTANANARIVAAFGYDVRVLAGFINSLARRKDRAGRFERYAGHDILATGDAAQNTAGVIG